MTRTLFFPITIMLALATGLTLFGIATTLTHHPIGVVPSAARSEREDLVEVVHRFYAAANEVLQTGDATTLFAAVTADYREHTARFAFPFGITGYTQFLIELRTACPDCRLKIEDLVMGPDEAAVRVSTHGIRQGTALGVSVDGLSLEWSALDVLRIVEGQVVERWSQSDALTVAEPLFTEVSVAIPTGVAIVQVSRLILPAGASLPKVAVLGPMLLVVEAGALTVETEHVSVSAQGPGSGPVDPVLGHGERLMIDPGVLPMVRNDGPLRAVVLVVVLKPGHELVGDVIALS